MASELHTPRVLSAIGRLRGNEDFNIFVEALRARRDDLRCLTEETDSTNILLKYSGASLELSELLNTVGPKYETIYAAVHRPR